MHTPGPWKYAPEGHIPGGPVYPVPSEGEPVAMVNTDDDGRLVAQAPALLAALEKIRDTIGPMRAMGISSVAIEVYKIAADAVDEVRS